MKLQFNMTQCSVFLGFISFSSTEKLENKLNSIWTDIRVHLSNQTGEQKNQLFI